MPIYEYKCTKCNEHFEVAQKMTDEPLKIHESCGGELKKLITNTSFVLKGSGWYVTDYPSTDRKKAIDSEKPKEKKKGKEAEKKTEAKKEKAEPAKAR
jgi:putative FmdB family regulatory protein